MASHRDPLRDYQVFADGLRDQNRVERQRGNQKEINESLSISKSKVRQSLSAALHEVVISTALRH